MVHPNTPKGTAPQQVDVPTVRHIKDYPFTVDQPTKLAPLPGYAGCIALVPVSTTAGMSLSVVLYVDRDAPHDVTWHPPAGTMIIDVPAGFAINDGDAILAWIERSPGAGRPGPVGSVKGHP
jgi:hypothetical protein